MWIFYDFFQFLKCYDCYDFQCYDFVTIFNVTIFLRFFYVTILLRKSTFFHFCYVFLLRKVDDLLRKVDVFLHFVTKFVNTCYEKSTKKRRKVDVLLRLLHIIPLVSSLKDLNLEPLCFLSIP